MQTTIRTTLAFALTLGAAAVVTAARPAAAATGNGSILYVKNHDVYAVRPDGTHARRITHNGGTATANHTGGIGYHAPSASSSGAVIVTVRNQKVSAVDTQGWIHVLTRNGAAIRTFHPLQFKHIVQDTSPCQAQQEPRGIVDATVSPDGKHIVYTALSNDETAGCNAGVGYSTYVVNINGTGAAVLKRGNGNSAAVEGGQWAGNSRVLLDDANAGSYGFWFDDLPSHTMRQWTQSASFSDGAFQQPALRKGKLASVGYSSVSSGNALRLWTSSGPTARPTRRCDLRSPIAKDVPDRPTWSPTANAVTFDVNDGNPAARTGEGVYVLSTPTLSASTCSGPRLLVGGAAAEPFWAATNLAG